MGESRRLGIRTRYIRTIHNAALSDLFAADRPGAPPSEKLYRLSAGSSAPLKFWSSEGNGASGRGAERRGSTALGVYAPFKVPKSGGSFYICAWLSPETFDYLRKPVGERSLHDVVAAFDCEALPIAGAVATALGAEPYSALIEYTVRV